MTRRPGMTMTEVLVTIFVVVIGLTGVMSMFPFAAKQMSDALISDRSTSLATSTDGLVRGYWNEKVVEDARQDDPSYTYREPFWVALDNPEAIGTNAQMLHPSGTRVRPQAGEASYPVFLDPMGVYRTTTNGANWVGEAATSIPRRSMNAVLYTPATRPAGLPATTPFDSRYPYKAGSFPATAVPPLNTRDKDLALRMFSQADGFGWDDTKDGAEPKTNFEMRELRYNALAVIQRPTNRDRFGATLKVVVFLNRRAGFFPTGSEAVFPNATAPAVVQFNPGTTQLQLSTNADIKKGSWIMDATVQNAAPFIRHANFYRVVSATESTTTPGFYDVELHTPIRRVDGKNTAADFYNGTVVVMAGVAEVFERAPLNGNTQP